MADIFLSYASEDRERVRLLVDALEAEGWTVWWDQQIHAGPTFRRAISEAIDSCRCMVVAWSRRSIESDFVIDEATEGKERNILVPLLLDDVQVPLGFRTAQTANLRDWPDDPGDLNGLLTGVRDTIDGTRSTPSPRHSPPRPRSRRPSAVQSFGILVFTVITGAILLWQPGIFEADSTASASIAVLPLENLSGDSAQQYFSDGMTDALIADLGKIEALKVISRHSTMRYRDTNKPLREIARELGVNHVVVGSVAQAEGLVRITVQLVEAETDQHLWSDSFMRERRGILALQAQVARTIAEQIKGQLDPQDEARLARATDVNPEAYEAYLKGRFHWARLSPAALDAALDYFELALEKDPDFALAYVGVSEVWSARMQMGLASPQKATPRSKAAATKALELDDTLAEVHHTLALQKTYMDWDWEGAGAAFRRAIEINPNYADARAFYSQFLSIMKRPDEAMAQIKRAIELDPFNSLFHALYATDLVFAHRYDEAIAKAHEAQKSGAVQGIVRTVLTVSLHMKGMYGEAFEEHRSGFAAKGDREAEQALVQGYQEGGYRGALGRLADTLAARSRTTFVAASQIAHAYVYAEQKRKGSGLVGERLREPRTESALYHRVATF